MSSSSSSARTTSDVVEDRGRRPPPPRRVRPPKAGPEPTLLSRAEVDALYETVEAVVAALDEIGVDYVVTGGSLLGAVRQRSILFCDDDVDVAILERTSNDGDGGDDASSRYELVRARLPTVLDVESFDYQIRPWIGGDRVRPKRVNTVFVDLFVLRRFESLEDLERLIGVKENGRPQPEEYVRTIVDTILVASTTDHDVRGVRTLPLCPFWHFNTRKAIELWPKEVYRERELFPLRDDLEFGPLRGIKGPRAPVTLLRRAFGSDCFEVYYPSASHKDAPTNGDDHHVRDHAKTTDDGDGSTTTTTTTTTRLRPLVRPGGTWEHNTKAPLRDEHYVPLQPTARSKRRPTTHDKASLMRWLDEQERRETQWMRADAVANDRDTTATTVYMDGVFDLFHVGHLRAIRICAALGDRVVLGVTGDDDAASYKRRPTISQDHRVAVLRSVREVDDVVCPCPLVVTKEFVDEHDIDLVVHGYADEEDAARQQEFFAWPAEAGRFRRIPYCADLSTTDIVRRIRGETTTT